MGDLVRFPVRLRSIDGDLSALNGMSREQVISRALHDACLREQMTHEEYVARAQERFADALKPEQPGASSPADSRAERRDQVSTLPGPAAPHTDGAA